MLPKSLIFAAILFVLTGKNEDACGQIPICKGEPTEEFYRFLNRAVTEVAFKQREVPSMSEFVYSLYPRFDKSIYELVIPGNLCFWGLEARRALIFISKDSIVNGVLIEIEQTPELINTIVAHLGAEGKSEWTVRSVLADEASINISGFHFWRCGDFVLSIDKKKTINDDRDTKTTSIVFRPAWDNLGKRL